MVKIDVFVPDRVGHHAAKGARAVRVRLAAASSQEVWVTGPGEVANQQWRDVTALLRVQRGRIDEPYLTRWADQLGVADLLARARTDG